MSLNDNFIGCCYFIKTENENLLSEYLNNFAVKPLTECCNLIDKNCKSKFGGIYKTSWVENKESVTSDLYICYFENKYKLVWKKQNEPIFYGLGFENNGVLTCCYTTNKITFFNDENCENK